MQGYILNWGSRIQHREVQSRENVSKVLAATMTGKYHKIISKKTGIKLLKVNL